MYIYIYKDYMYIYINPYNVSLLAIALAPVLTHSERPGQHALMAMRQGIGRVAGREDPEQHH